MKNRHIAVIILIVLIAGASLACGGSKAGVRTIEGTLDSWTFDPPSIMVSGTEYGLATGMEAHLENAEAGMTYKFTIDQHGNVIAVKPAG